MVRSLSGSLSQDGVVRMCVSNRLMTKTVDAPDAPDSCCMGELGRSLPGTLPLKSKTPPVSGYALAS